MMGLRTMSLVCGPDPPPASKHHHAGAMSSRSFTAFPALQAVAGPLTERHARFVMVLDLARGQWIDTVHQRRPPRVIVLDMDSSESPTYGGQEASAYNSHFGCTCYHPLFVFNKLGDLERCALRPGNAHSATGWREVLEPVVAR
jgi:Transposase DDE domain group 1